QMKREDFDAAEKRRAEVLVIKKKLKGENHWQVTDARLALQDVALKRRLSPAQRGQLAFTAQLVQEAVQLNNAGKWREAIEPASQVIEVRRKVLGERHLAYASGLSFLASLHYALDEYSKAELLWREAMDIRKTVLGEKHPDYATSLENL